MAYALVGSAGTVATGTNSVSPTFAQSTTAGNLLVAWIGCENVGTTITTSASGWTIANGNASSCQNNIWYKENCGAGETAPTFTTAGASYAALAEFSGGATSGSLDQSTAGPSGASTPQTATNPSADAASGQLVVACTLDILSKSGTTTTSHTYNNGVSATTNLNNDSTSSISHYRFSWGTSTGNSVADNCASADSSMNLSTIQVCLSSFKLAPTTPPPAPRFVQAAFVEIRPNV